MDKKPRVIAVVGTNASGKSGLGIQLAAHFNGEVISADSRQVYTGLDLGSGKVTEVTCTLMGISGEKPLSLGSAFVR